ncbi:MAG: NADAR family protein [Chitinophagaceae bacterium]|nr:NADAR family protein [Chitinophagaceae bacterium]
MKYTLPWLQQQYAINKNNEYIFFWGHTPKSGQIVDKSCFSQWYPAAFVADGITYATTEHWMMAKKAILFSDDLQLKNILSDDSPANAKKAGRAVRNFNPEQWQKNAYQYVVEGNRLKFSQHSALKQFLVNTKDAIIVEASPFDNIWGIGIKDYETDPFKWQGTNLLGFALMEVRDILKEI